MDLHYSEDEEVEKLKAWWKKNGSSLIYGSALGIAVIVGFNYWQSYTRTNAENASALYEQMSVYFEAEQSQDVENTGGKLMKDFASSPYAVKAALLLARVSVENKDIPTAISRLSWVLDNSSESASLHVARLRLASIHMGQNELDKALTLLAIAETGSFKTHYRELQGDIFYQQGDLTKAKTAYQDALDSLPEGSGYRQILDMKLDNSSTGKN